MTKRIKKQARQQAPNFFKDKFTLKQFSALSLAYNQGNSQIDSLSKTSHYRRIFKDRNPSGFCCQNGTIKNKIIEKLRNYFSHVVHKDLDDLKKNYDEIKKDIYFRIQEASIQLLGKNKNFDSNEEDSEEIHQLISKAYSNPELLFDLDFPENIEHGKNQALLALIIAPFLTKEQIRLLLDKIFWKKNGNKERKNKKVKKSIERQAREEIIRELSPAPSALIDSLDFLTDEKTLLAMAMLERLRYALGLNENNESNKDNKSTPSHQQSLIQEDFPEDGWFMKQMILFLEQSGKLPNMHFERTKTEFTEDSLKQTTVYEKEQETYPLKIKFNTIRIEIDAKGSKFSGILGLQTLKYLVLAVIKNKRDNNIHGFIKDWHTENNKRCKKIRSNSSAKNLLKERIAYCIKKAKSINNSERLYEKIRFITERINKAYEKKHKNTLNKERFKNYMSKVRYFKREYLQSDLKQDKIWETREINLGKENDKSLKDLIQEEEDLKKVSNSILDAHIEYLESCQKNLGEMDEEKKNSLGKDLKLRGLDRGNKESSKNNFAQKENSAENKGFDKLVGMSREVVKEKFFPNSSNKKFIDLVQEISAGDTLDFSQFSLDTDKGKKAWLRNKTENRKEISKKREKWARSQLIALMSKNLMDSTEIELKSGNNTGIQISNLQSLSQMPITIKIGEYRISCTMTQSLRHYAKNRVKKLINTYTENAAKQEIPLLSQGENSKQDSIESLLKEVRKERFFLLKAFFLWEESKTEAMELKEGECISFDKVLKRAKLDNELQRRLKDFRNSCFHEDIPDSRFSEVSSPIKEFYEEQEQSQRTRRKQNQKRAYKNRQYDA